MTLADEIQKVAKQYPESRSAVLPALRMAQERHGWLSTEAIREVADALDLTPAYCKSVASFYDMFHLQPVGRHIVEVCTNVSCALVGAQQVLEAFEQELDTRAGENSPDGTATLKAIESPRGEFGTYLVSDGGSRPWRVKFRAPSFFALQATATCMSDAYIADLIAIVGSLDSVMGEVDR